MAKLIVTSIVSLDGHYAAEDGNPLVLPMDAGFDAHNLELIRSAEALLLGATSYQMFMGFWPIQATNPEAPAVHREFGEIYARIPVKVVSDSLTPDDVAPWAGQTEIVRRADAEARVRALKGEPGGDLVSFASRTTWSPLLRAGLVDELHLVVGATVLGTGTPLFTEPVGGLSLAGVRQLDGSDNVSLRYAVSGS